MEVKPNPNPTPNTNPFVIERMSKETETETRIEPTTLEDLPLSDHRFDDHNINDEEEALIMETFTSNPRCCFFFPCLGSQPSPTRSSTLTGLGSSPSMWEKLQQNAESKNKWWAGPIKGLKKIREWSEIIAGPKWKTFIRRFNRGAGGKNGPGKFQYDPLSYALNFDEGPGQNSNFNSDSNFPDFSSRYASIPNFCKSSMDLGKNGFPSLS